MPRAFDKPGRAVTALPRDLAIWFTLGTTSGDLRNLKLPRLLVSADCPSLSCHYTTLSLTSSQLLLLLVVLVKSPDRARPLTN